MTEDETAAGRRRGGGGHAGWTWAAGTVLVAALLMFCYLRMAGATQVNSDGAGLVLEAWNVLHGNVLLRGWWATDVSFYTTELPEYVAVTAVAGLRPEVVHICAALTYTMLVLLAAFVARGRAHGAEGVIRAVLAAGIILAPQPTGPTQVLLGSPDHVGTGVPVLLLLLLLDWASARPRGPRWYVPVAAGVLLSWAIIGDPLIEVVGVVPLFLASLIRAGRVLWAARPAGPAGSRPLRSMSWVWPAAWYELALAAAAAVAIPVKHLAGWLLADLGGIQTARAYYHALPVHEIIAGLPMAARSVFALFGADYMGVYGTGYVTFACVHFIGVAVVFCAAAYAAWRLLLPAGRLLPRRGPGAPDAAQYGDLVADILVLAMAANFAAFLLEVRKNNIYAAHEIGPMLSFGAALAGRMFGGPILAGWTRARRAAADRGGERRARAPRAGLRRAGLGRVLLPALAAGLVCYAALLGVAAAHTQARPRNVGLTAWLEQHRLNRGLAPYWEASSITVDSGGAVTVLAVSEGGWHGHIRPFKWQSDVQLAHTMANADFVIISPSDDVHRNIVLDTFGRPAGSYRYGPYTILTWRKNLLPALILSVDGPHMRTVSTARRRVGAAVA
jgi:hypothetical protein